MQRSKHTIIDREGNAQAAAVATVYVTGSTTELATIYSDNGVTAIVGSQVTADYNGEVVFYAADGTYDMKVEVSGQPDRWVLEIQLADQTPHVIDVTSYGAVGDGITDDTAAIQAAIDAAELTSAEVLVPAGEYSTDGSLSCDSGPISIHMLSGSEITSSSTTAQCITVSGANEFVLYGEGKITGPGKATATSSCYGIWLDSSSRCLIEGIEISGFYHGIRPDDSAGSENNTFSLLYIHDNAFSGIFPKNGDKVLGCKFKDIGTTSLHHGCYVNTAIAKGIQFIGNSYDTMTGAGVHIHLSAAIDAHGIVCLGETMINCGWGYVVSAGHVGATITGLNISGAVVTGSIVTDGDTGHGVHLITTGSISGSHIQAVINDCAAHGFNCDASDVTDSHFDIVVGECVDYGAVLTCNNSTGRFVAHDGTDIGVYVNGGVDNHLDITTTSNGNTGVYITGASTGNYIKLYSSDNTGNGIYLGASADDNRVSGICQGNSAAQVNDNGGDNDLFGLTGSAFPVAPLSGNGSPAAAVTATFVGQMYIDTTGHNVWCASATGTANWIDITA